MIYLSTIDIIDYLIQLEHSKLINNIEINKIKNNIQFEEIVMIYELKRSLNDFSTIQSYSSLIKDCKESDIFLSPYINILISENLFLDGKYKESEEMINQFWLKCTKRLNTWVYNNYSAMILNGIRLGFWDGSRVSDWNDKFRNQYTDHKNYDSRFINLNKSIKYLVTTIFSNSVDEPPRE